MLPGLQECVLSSAEYRGFAERHRADKGTDERIEEHARNGGMRYMKCILVPMQKRTISNCGYCPYRNHDTSYCTQSHRKIQSIRIIPNWCKLNECKSSRKSKEKPKEKEITKPEERRIEQSSSIQIGQLSEFEWMNRRNEK
jgi:hypothetical protein